MMRASAELASRCPTISASAAQMPKGGARTSHAGTYLQLRGAAAHAPRVLPNRSCFLTTGYALTCTSSSVSRSGLEAPPVHIWLHHPAAGVRWHGMFVHLPKASGQRWRKWVGISWRPTARTLSSDSRSGSGSSWVHRTDAACKQTAPASWDRSRSAL